MGFQPYAQPVFTRCMALMHSTLASEARGEDGDKELVVCSLDLISGRTDGINPHPNPNPNPNANPNPNLSRRR